MVITLLSDFMPKSLYSSRNWLLRERRWERKGEVYQQWLKVKHWKKFLPELSDFVKTVFPKKEIRDFSREYLDKYLFESCKSEITHWCIILSSLLFFLWAEFEQTGIMIIIAIVLNLPYIIIQRYNRPRIAEAAETIDSHRKKLLI
jgi:glycosyl-4,4'-diaponeurosporenoate acyltransferase